MKSLRRIITVILAVSMLITSLGLVAFAETSFSDITDSKVEEAVSKLVAYGIINGYEDGTFRPDNQITRAEFAAIVTRMKGVANNLPQDSVTGFADLDNDSSSAWARPYVKVAADLGIINGFDDGTFRAKEPVTYEQAVKMLVCAIGYETVAKSEYNKLYASNTDISWSAGYISAAVKHGITKNAYRAVVTGPAERGIVAILTSNSLEVPALREDENGNLVKDETGSGATESTMTTITGVITDTFYTGLDDDETGLSEKEIVIDSTENDFDGTYDLSSSLLESIELDKYIGRKVTAYYDNFEREITSIRLEKVASKTIKEEHIVSVDANQIKTKDENGKTAVEDISNATYIVNGKYVDSYDFDTFKNGTIEIFTASGKKIVCVSSYDVFVVNSFDKTNRKIYIKYATYDHDNKSETEEVNYCDLPKRDIDLPKIYVASSGSTSYKLTEYSSLSLSQYDVINYLESPAGSAGDPVRKMYVTKGSKSGKVTSGGLNSNRKVELNDKEMYLTQQYRDYDDTGKTDKKAPFELSETYTYYLDYCGQIAAINYSEASSGSSWAYGYLVAGYKREGEVSIIRTDGNLEYYELKDTVKVDGDKKKGDAVFDVLMDAADNVNGNANASTLTPSEDEYQYAQPIKYSLSGGKIEGFDTVLEGDNPGSAGDNFTYDGKLGDEPTSTTTTKVTAGGESYNVSSSTFVLYVPKDRDDEDSYAKMSASSAFAVNGNRYVEVFGVDNKLAKMVVVYGVNPTLNFTGGTPYFIVTEIGGAGDNVTIKGYKNGSETEATVIVSEDKFITSIGEHNLVTVDEIEKGDVIRYIADNKGEAIAIELFYDSSEDAMYDGESNEEDYIKVDNTSSKLMAIFGTVTSKYANEADSRIDIDADGGKTQKFGTNTKVFKLTSEGEVEIASMDAVSDGTEGMDASKVIVFVRSTSSTVAAQTIYVIE